MADTFFNRSVEEVLQEQESSSGGLSNAQAADRLKKYGPNALVEGKKKGVLQVFLEQFKDLLVVILIVAAIISMLSPAAERAPSSSLPFSFSTPSSAPSQYFKAEKSLESLKAMSSPNGQGSAWTAQRWRSPPKRWCPGDIVFLEAGDLVVADGRMIENFSLKVNESSLTGEIRRGGKDRGGHPRREGGPGRPEEHGLFRFPGDLRPRHCCGDRHRHAHRDWARSPR